jgi:hypothetical protein
MLIIQADQCLSVEVLWTTPITLNEAGRLASRCQTVQYCRWKGIFYELVKKVAESE